MDSLVETATNAAVGALTKAAVEPALAAGRKVWDWLRGRVAGDDARTVAAIEADPAKPSAPTKITALLQDLLHDNPDAIAQLRALLEGAGGLQAINQTANITGDNNKVAQVAGTGNKVRIS